MIIDFNVKTMKKRVKFLFNQKQIIEPRNYPNIQLLLFVLLISTFMTCMYLYPCILQQFNITYTGSNESKHLAGIQRNIIFRNLLLGWIIQVRIIIAYIKKYQNNVCVYYKWVLGNTHKKNILEQ